MDADGRRWIGLTLALAAAGGYALAQRQPEAGKLLQAACVQCHDLRPIAAQRKERAAWRRTVNEMIWRGAPLLPGEAAILVDYLAAEFGRDAPEGGLR